MEMVENHITDFAAGMYPSTFIPEDHIKHTFPNSVFPYILEGKTVE